VLKKEKDSAALDTSQAAKGPAGDVTCMKGNVSSAGKASL
jgi:hypothetical protein